MSAKHFIRQQCKQRGMTFIEVLVALVILVTGILGAVALQASAKKGSFDAMQRSLASSLVQDMLERMRTNNTAILASYAKTDYGVALDAVPAVRCATPTTLCTPAQRVINDQYEWELALMGADTLQGTNYVGGLAGARGVISLVGNALTITISWQGRVEITDSKAVAKSKARQVVVEAFIY